VPPRIGGARGTRCGGLFAKRPKHPGQAAERDTAGRALVSFLGRDQPGNQRVVLTWQTTRM
jgi:hypothetical protein